MHDRSCIAAGAGGSGIFAHWNLLKVSLLSPLPSCSRETVQTGEFASEMGRVLTYPGPPGKGAWRPN